MDILSILIIAYFFIGLVLIGLQAWYDKKKPGDENELSNGFKVISLVFMPSAFVGISVVFIYYFITEFFKVSLEFLLSPKESLRKFAIWWSQKS